jgi:hypothetical protein
MALRSSCYFCYLTSLGHLADEPGSVENASKSPPATLGRHPVGHPHHQRTINRMLQFVHGAVSDNRIANPNFGFTPNKRPCGRECSSIYAKSPMHSSRQNCSGKSANVRGFNLRTRFSTRNQLPRQIVAKFDLTCLFERFYNNSAQMAENRTRRAIRLPVARGESTYNRCRDFCRDTPSKWWVFLGSPYTPSRRIVCCNGIKTSKIGQCRALLSKAEF